MGYLSYDRERERMRKRFPRWSTWKMFGHIVTIVGYRATSNEIVFRYENGSIGEEYYTDAVKWFVPHMTCKNCGMKVCIIFDYEFESEKVGGYAPRIRHAAPVDSFSRKWFCNNYSNRVAEFIEKRY